MPSDRRRARILAMQTLCQWDVQRDTSGDVLDEVSDADDEDATPQRVVRYARTLVEGFWARHNYVDRRLKAALEKWSLSRLSPVERNAMRVAVVELVGDDVPGKVAINEAIEIAREYGGADSPRFVNGVLDKVLSNLAKKKEGD